MGQTLSSVNPAVSLLLGAALLGAAMAWSGQAPAPDPVLRAMHDEMERSRTLTVSNLEAPYFIEYLMDEEENFSVSASLGGLLARRHEHFRSPEVHVRVGDYKFDNTNFSGGGGAFGARYDLERFPLEDDYPVLRRYFWLETDSAYKSARGSHLAQAGGAAQPHARASSSTISRTPSRCTTSGHSASWPSTKKPGATACARSPRCSRRYPEVKNSERGAGIRATAGTTW